VLGLLKKSIHFFSAGPTFCANKVPQSYECQHYRESLTLVSHSTKSWSSLCLKSGGLRFRLSRSGVPVGVKIAEEVHPLLLSRSDTLHLQPSSAKPGASQHQRVRWTSLKPQHSVLDIIVLATLLRPQYISVTQNEVSAQKCEHEDNSGFRVTLYNDKIATSEHERGSRRTPKAS